MSSNVGHDLRASWSLQMHKKHEPCKDTTHLGTEDFLKHLQSLPSYANQARLVGSSQGNDIKTQIVSGRAVVSVVTCQDFRMDGGS